MSERRKLYKNYGCRFEVDILLRLHIRLDVKNSSLEDEVVGIIFSLERDGLIHNYAKFHVW